MTGYGKKKKMNLMPIRGGEQARARGDGGAIRWGDVGGGVKSGLASIRTQIGLGGEKGERIILPAKKLTHREESVSLWKKYNWEGKDSVANSTKKRRWLLQPLKQPGQREGRREVFRDWICKDWGLSGLPRDSERKSSPITKGALPEKRSWEYHLIRRTQNN